MKSLYGCIIVDNKATILHHAKAGQFSGDYGEHNFAKENALTHITSVPKRVEIQQAMMGCMAGAAKTVKQVPLIFGVVLDASITYIGPDRWLIAAATTIPVDHELTDRQIEILEALANDESLPDVAKALGVSESTIASHLQTARAKTGHHNTTGLLAWAVSRQIVRTR